MAATELASYMSEKYFRVLKISNGVRGGGGVRPGTVESEELNKQQAIKYTLRLFLGHTSSNTRAATPPGRLKFMTVG